MTVPLPQETLYGSTYNCRRLCSKCKGSNWYDLKDTEHIEFIYENHTDFVRSIKEHEGKDIWVVGGGQINTMLLNAELIDEILG